MAKSKSAIGETISTVFWAIVIAGAFRTLLFQPFWIPSESMKSTLLVGDFVFVNKFAYGFSRHSCPWSLCPISGRIMGSEPERGDVIVFRHPVNGSDMVKRLIGLPGDKVQVLDGVLYLNGAAAPQTPDGTFEEVFEAQGPMASRPSCKNGIPDKGAICQKDAFRETLPGGRSHAILNIEDGGFADNTDVFEVPPGHYFFMGDNRDNSQDSRFSQAVGGVGFVPAENLIGRADRVIFSSAGKRILYFWTWRSDRLFVAVE
jgi:signal peptidase I